MDGSYGWHTVAWMLVALASSVVFFRLGGFGMDRHESLPDETSGALMGCLNTLARLVCGLLVAFSTQFALFGWPFMGWSARV